MENLLLIGHVDKVVRSIHPPKYLEGSFQCMRSLFSLVGNRTRTFLVSFLKSSDLGSGVEVMPLLDLTPAELIVSEIPSLLKLVSEVCDVLVRGPRFGILLFLSPKLAENLEWSIHGVTIEHLIWCKSETFLRSAR